MPTEFRDGLPAYDGATFVPLGVSSVLGWLVVLGAYSLDHNVDESAPDLDVTGKKT